MKGSTIEFETFVKDLHNEQLGAILREYVAESNHSGWEGFKSSDMTGINRFLYDLMMYYRNSDRSGESFAQDIDTTNPVP